MIRISHINEIATINHLPLMLQKNKEKLVDMMVRDFSREKNVS